MLLRLAMQAHFLHTSKEEAVGDYTRMLAEAAKQGFTLDSNGEGCTKVFCEHCELPLQKSGLLFMLAPQD